MDVFLFEYESRMELSEWKHRLIYTVGYPNSKSKLVLEITGSIDGFDIDYEMPLDEFIKKYKYLLI